jgi:hypothetical protein
MRVNDVAGNVCISRRRGMLVDIARRFIGCHSRLKRRGFKMHIDDLAANVYVSVKARHAGRYCSPYHEDAT